MIMKSGQLFVTILLISSTFSFPADLSNDVEHEIAIDAISPEKNFLNSSSQFENLTYKPQWLAPFINKLQFSPQTFLHEKLAKLKDGLKILGIPGSEVNVTGKQLTNGILHLAGVSDPDFYTNRLDPAGFFEGNGWWANKGGLLGGPGAIFSTGSFLTDYPSAYKKK